MFRVLLFVAALCVPTCLYAQPGPGPAPPMKVGCFKDIIRNCAGMSANSIPLPGIDPMPTASCINLVCGPDPDDANKVKCSAKHGISTVNEHGFHDVDNVAPMENGRSNLNHMQEPWHCGKIYTCKCEIGWPNCFNLAFVVNYTPVQFSTVGPLDCVGPPLPEGD